ncbi:extradiol ring-cleavage dioxygenase [Eremomyces bilateralis CBS 781.70]|uniref:Extradiol ring-cleavage dioxygenase n=1 Tax=Eremomyces bilateralis CBS 781.70 TaxID=1392243 RepID=A0A6G1G1Z6_9PEZI|nr:extradiol ring-cleavage dioxygenase [Eremomyces bilateralis CBS 781.70]KAF1811829.1 extradiol ring-cleavage dioxygenase [Eremomyces bilateralis CBS 781.70]
MRPQRILRSVPLLLSALPSTVAQQASHPQVAFNFNPLEQTFHWNASSDPRLALNMTAKSDIRAPVIALSHGGGPMPVLGDPSHESIVRSLKTKVPKILKLGTEDAPRAIVLVTAHWSQQQPAISSAEKHQLFYDYGGFPSEAYSLQYDAPGSPEIAEEVRKAMAGEGLKAKMDDVRGWDHGVFIPMLLVHPSATIPIVQVSVLSSESVKDHYAMGRALGYLREQNIAVVGSGFASFHNIRTMFSGRTGDPGFQRKLQDWNDGLKDITMESDAVKRGQRFEGWRELPMAYEAHPRGGAEHFLPLVVCAGAAGDGKAMGYADEFLGLDIWSYYWE